MERSENMVKKRSKQSEKELFVKESFMFFFFEISIQTDEGILLRIQKPKILIKLILQLHLLALTILLKHPFLFLVIIVLLIILKDLFLNFHCHWIQPHLIKLLNYF